MKPLLIGVPLTGLHFLPGGVLHIVSVRENCVLIGFPVKVMSVRTTKTQQDFERILKTHHASLMGDPFIKLYMDDILRTMRTQVCRSILFSFMSHTFHKNEILILLYLTFWEKKTKRSGHETTYYCCTWLFKRKKRKVEWTWNNNHNNIINNNNNDNNTNNVLPPNPSRAIYRCCSRLSRLTREWGYPTSRRSWTAFPFLTWKICWCR